LTEAIDTSTPGGKLAFHLFGALAEFEKDLIRERTMAGLAAARARGRTGGRPTVWTPAKLEVAMSMFLRLYFASLLIASGLNVKVVQTRLRHGSAMTTLNTYGHMWPDADESLRAAIAVVLAAHKDASRTKRLAD